MGKRKVAIRAALFLAALGAAALAPRSASADGDDLHASRPGVTLGGRAAYFHPKDADKGTLSGGAQLRLHFTSVLALEASVDYRQSKYEGTIADIYPAQASLILYLAPNWIVSPYILGGEGWYHTHIRGANGSTSERYGPHAGAGVEIALARHWSVDASYRYLWAQSLSTPTSAHPLGRNFSDNGYMLTGALNYRF